MEKQWPAENHQQHQCHQSVTEAEGPLLQEGPGTEGYPEWVHWGGLQDECQSGKAVWDG